MLEKEFKYFLDNQTSLVQKYRNLYIVIVSDKVVGSYRTNEIALYESKQRYKEGTFLIQHCIEGENAYTCTFHSNIINDGKI